MYTKLHNFLDIKQPKDLSIFISIFKNIEYYREITSQEKEIAVNIEKVLIGQLGGNDPFKKLIEDKNKKLNAKEIAKKIQPINIQDLSMFIYSLGHL